MADISMGLGIGAPGETFTLHDETLFTPASNTLVGIAVVVSNKGDTTPVYVDTAQELRRRFGPVTKEEGLSKACLYKAIQTIPHWVVRVVDDATARVGCLGFNIGDSSTDPSFGPCDPTQQSTLDDNDLVFTSLNPGNWINGVWLRLTNFIPATRQFDLLVYPPNGSGTSFLQPLERYTVTMDDSKNGFYQQQEIAQTINDGSQSSPSSYIRVVHGNTGRTLDKIFNKVLTLQKTNPSENVTYDATFSNGANGNWPTDSQIAEAFQQFADPQKYDFWVVSSYGLGSDTVRASINEVVTSRPNCIGIIDVPTANQNTSGDGTSESVWMANSGLTSSQMYAYTPDIYTTVEDLSSNTYLPPSGLVVQQLGRTWNQNGLFQAPAGRRRGAVADALGVRVIYSGAREGDKVSGGLNSLANNRVNPVVRNPNGGYMLGDVLSAQTYTSMLSFMQVQMGVIFIRRLVLQIAGNYEFDNITPTEMYQIQNQIYQPLARLVNQGNLKAATVVCDSSNNPEEIAITGELHIDVYVAFFGFARQIRIDAYLTKDAASFETFIESNSVAS